MLVAQVVLPASRRKSWTLLGADGVPVEPVEGFLAFLTDVERSPNTIKAYAHDLKDWFVFLVDRGLDWREVRLEDIGEFVAWLRLPPPARDGCVAVLPSVTAHCGEATVNRKLSAISAFYQHAARNGVDLGELLTTWQPAGRRATSWRPFLHHISKSQPAARRTVGLKVPRKQPRVLGAAEVQAILDGCGRLRDRLLFAVLFGTGMRIGEALGLRHQDWAAAERSVAVVPRDNDNGARVKSGQPRTIPVAAELIRLYADYLHGEYGELDSDYVFVNLWGARHGHPLTYAAVYDLVRRLRRRTGVDFDPHWASGALDRARRRAGARGGHRRRRRAGEGPAAGGGPGQATRGVGRRPVPGASGGRRAAAGPAPCRRHGDLSAGRRRRCGCPGCGPVWRRGSRGCSPPPI